MREVLVTHSFLLSHIYFVIKKRRMEGNYNGLHNHAEVKKWQSFTEINAVTLLLVVLILPSHSLLIIWKVNREEV